MFITFEGPDGSGKTTQTALLVQYLKEKGYPIVATREPGGTEIGTQIRQVVHDLKHTEMHTHTEVLLYAASRAQLVGQLIRPSLADGKIVICDRYLDSTLAYQGYGRGIDLDQLKSIQQFATGGLKPDLTLYFDIDVETALARRKNANEEWNRMDALALEFYQRVRDGYQQLMTDDPQRWVKINAAQSIEAIHQDVLAIVQPRLGKI